MTYKSDCTLPEELLDQINDQGLNSGPGQAIEKLDRLYAQSKGREVRRIELILAAGTIITG